MMGVIWLSLDYCSLGIYFGNLANELGWWGLGFNIYRREMEKMVCYGNRENLWFDQNQFMEAVYKYVFLSMPFLPDFIKRLLHLNFFYQFAGSAKFFSAEC